MTMVDARGSSRVTGSHSATDVMLQCAANFAAARRTGGEPIRARPARPATGVAVLACMDARLDVNTLLGLDEGDAHILRNAGGVVTDDMIRSLAVSQHQLGTTEIILLHHTQCGMMTVTDDGFREQLFERTGFRPPWPVHAFCDLEVDVRTSVARLRASPFLAASTSVRGFIYDVVSGVLREVDAGAEVA